MNADVEVTAVRVDPELLRLEELKHLLDTVLDLLLAGDTRGVDVVDTRSDVTRVSRVDEDLEQLSIRLAVLDGQDIGIQSRNGVEEVLELGVAEVRVDLGSVLNASGGQAESLDSPVQVGLTLLAGAERQTLTQGRLIDLDDINAGLLEVDDFVTKSQSKLLGLDGLVNVVTREGPSEASDRSSQHTLHGLLGDRHGVLGLLDGHRQGTRDVTDNDGRTDASGPVALNPGVGGEGITIHALTEELHHVVTLRLTVNEDVQVKLLLDLDVHLNLLLNELVVLSSSDLTLGELVALETDLLGLREGADGSGGEERQIQLLLLLRDSLGELGLAVVVGLSDLGLAILDLGVVGASRGGTSLDRLGVGLELLTNGSRTLSNCLGNDGNFDGLLGREREPVSDLGVELLLAGESVGSVEERGGSSDDDAVSTQLLGSGLDGLDGTLEVGLPDVSAIDNTSRQDGLGAQGTNDGLELLRVADKVDVNSVHILGHSLQVVDDVTEVGGEDQVGDLVTQAGELLVRGLESGLGLGRKVENQDGLVDLDSGGTSSLQLDKELLVDRHKLVEQVNWVNALTTVGLAEVEERDRSDKNGAGLDTSLLSLVELEDGLRVGSQLEGLVVLESRLDVVVVGVKPLDHLQSRNVNTVLLVTTTHGKVFIDTVQLGAGITLRNSLDGVILATRHIETYTKVLDVAEDLVVQGKVVRGDDVDTGILLDLPVSESESLGLSEELILRDLAAPVTVDTHAGETENGRLNHDD
ncbi:hypothetical protein VM1G_11931 [Cytospora mali]|uniref:Uncharacterized protein n=1 Tax=Cytospora mali TaxID=578113 RepID=A0A194WC25_CYTMA|nr:hypothetical protein VM1G_11931 [Valsa mali]